MQITNQIYKILSQFSDLLLDFSKFFLSTFILTYSRTYRPLHSPRKVRMNYKNFRLDYRNINFIFQTLKPNLHGNKQFPGYALERCADRGRARIAGLDAPQRHRTLQGQRTRGYRQGALRTGGEGRPGDLAADVQAGGRRPDGAVQQHRKDERHDHRLPPQQRRG